MNETKVNRFVSYLGELFPSAKCELNYDTPFHFLVAVILSAQCTDKRVNLITPILFERYKTAFDFANANIHDVEEIIKPCGFYHNKAKNIVNMSKLLCEKYNGILPTTVSELMTLPGVGMKTAKVVCGDLFDSKVIAVDTHVKRIANRLGLVNCDDANKISVQLEKIFDSDFSAIHHRLVFFGRYHCKSQNPKCSECKIKDICKYYNR